MKLFTSNFEVPTISYDLSDTLGKWVEEKHSEMLEQRLRESRKTRDVPSMTPQAGPQLLSAAAQAEQKLEGDVVSDMIPYLMAGIALAVEGSVHQHNLVAMRNAIVDSGGSGIYVNKCLKLQNVRPG